MIKSKSNSKGVGIMKHFTAGVIFRDSVFAKTFSLTCLSFLLVAISAYGQNMKPLGSMKFVGETKVGSVSVPCSVKYNLADKTYRITGSGNNMWFNEDDFFYVWRKAKGGLKVETDVTWIGKGKVDDRKAAWVIRAGLEKDDPYIDAVDHGRGLICMQYRLVKGGTTLEVRSPIWAPARMILERTGNQFTMWVMKDGKKYTVGTVTVDLPEEVYAGL